MNIYQSSDSKVEAIALCGYCDQLPSLLLDTLLHQRVRLYVYVYMINRNKICEYLRDHLLSLPHPSPTHPPLLDKLSECLPHSPTFELSITIQLKKERCFLGINYILDVHAIYTHCFCLHIRFNFSILHSTNVIQG